jgi:hypothetical protein
MKFASLDRAFALIVGILLVIGLAVGFWMVGSPITARTRKFDERRLNDLRAISQAIERMVVTRDNDGWHLARALPERLEDVAKFVRNDEYSRPLVLVDPATNQPYGYKVRSESEYELCATFAFPSTDEGRWNHPAGQHCFVINPLKR